MNVKPDKPNNRCSHRAGPARFTLKGSVKVVMVIMMGVLGLLLSPILSFNSQISHINASIELVSDTCCHESVDIHSSTDHHETSKKESNSSCDDCDQCQCQLCMNAVKLLTFTDAEIFNFASNSCVYHISAQQSSSIASEDPLIRPPIS